MFRTHTHWMWKKNPEKIFIRIKTGFSKEMHFSWKTEKRKCDTHRESFIWGSLLLRLCHTEGTEMFSFERQKGIILKSAVAAVVIDKSIYCQNLMVAMFGCWAPFDFISCLWNWCTDISKFSIQSFFSLSLPCDVCLLGRWLFSVWLFTFEMFRCHWVFFVWEI